MRHGVIGDDNTRLARPTCRGESTSDASPAQSATMYRGTVAVMVSAIFSGLSALFIILRCISRFFIVKAPGVEDYLIISSLVLSIGLTVNIELRKSTLHSSTYSDPSERRNGLGRHANTVSAEENVRLLQLLYASIFIYNTGLFTCKGSIVYQYLRFFVERTFRRLAWALIAVIVVGALTFLLGTALTCMPVDKFWYVEKPGGCINKQAFWYSFSSFNLVTDFACLALPIPVLWKLQLPRRQKISLLFVFGLGAL
jgi:hypothetical protein